MGPNSKLYLSLIDETFHRGNAEPLAVRITKRYRSHDPFLDEGEIGGRMGLSKVVLRELRDVRYDTCDVFEQDERVAARWVMTARRSNGTRVVVPGISINRVEDERLDEGWIIADYGDISDLAHVAKLPGDAWAGAPLRIEPEPPDQATSRLAMYCWMTQQLYGERRPEALAEAMHPDYVGFDPFRDRGMGVAGSIAFHEKVLAMYRELRYHVLDAVEAQDRLAVRYRVEGTDSNGRRVVVPGMSINHFDGTRIRRGWVLNHYGALK
ncbi:MAG TPA: nuclear transport factor 2 family protein [Kofleriaceae bacterium]